MNNSISLEQAQLMLQSLLPLRQVEEISLAKAYKRVLAKDVFAVDNLPTGYRSAVDGYALGDGNVLQYSLFKLKGYLRLDEACKDSLKSGEAMGVLTGGLLPPGCKAVVNHEKAVVDGIHLKVLEEVKEGQNIRTEGEDYKQGELMLATGQVLDPGAIGLLSAFGVGKITVFKQPRVSVLSLGDNVVPWHQTPIQGQTRDSNSQMLKVLIEQDGGLVKDISIVASSSIEEQCTIIQDMLERNDILICTGRSYIADGFNTQQVFAAVGGKIIFRNIPIQPGSHTVAARHRNTFLFSLSGNPAACFVNYQLFVAPVIRAMQGKKAVLQKLNARCTNSYLKQVTTRRLVRGHAEYTPRGWEVSVLPGQKPSMLKSLVKCNALIDLPAGHPPVEVNMQVPIILLYA